MNPEMFEAIGIAVIGIIGAIIRRGENIIGYGKSEISIRNMGTGIEVVTFLSKEVM